MTIAQHPQIFDLRSATPVPGAADPDLSCVFWHGTRVGRLESILDQGLLPEKSCIGHTCLARSPEIALYYGRLQQSFGGGSNPEDAPVLIRVNGSHLDPQCCVPEHGCAGISAYGCDRPGRKPADLSALPPGWRPLLNATECLGYSGNIPVSEDMIDRRAAELPAISIDALIKDDRRGFPSQPEAIQLLEKIASEIGMPLAA